MDAATGGRHVILDIDVQGARQIREAVPEALLLFILPPSVEVLFQRLAGRGSEGEETLRVRLTTALQELEAAETFDFFVINDDLERAVGEIRSLARLGKPPSAGSSASLEDVQELRRGIEALLSREILLEDH
jgi:guanylate kinase